MFLMSMHDYTVLNTVSAIMLKATERIFSHSFCNMPKSISEHGHASLKASVSQAH